MVCVTLTEALQTDMGPLLSWPLLSSDSNSECNLLLNPMVSGFHSLLLHLFLPLLFIIMLSLYFYHLPVSLSLLKLKLLKRKLDLLGPCCEQFDLGWKQTQRQSHAVRCMVYDSVCLCRFRTETQTQTQTGRDTDTNTETDTETLSFIESSRNRHTDNVQDHCPSTQ